MIIKLTSTMLHWTKYETLFSVGIALIEEVDSSRAFEDICRVSMTMTGFGKYITISLSSLSTCPA